MWVRLCLGTAPSPSPTLGLGALPRPGSPCSSSAAPEEWRGQHMRPQALITPASSPSCPSCVLDDLKTVQAPPPCAHTSSSTNRRGRGCSRPQGCHPTSQHRDTLHRLRCEDGLSVPALGRGSGLGFSHLPEGAVVWTHGEGLAGTGMWADSQGVPYPSGPEFPPP